MLSSLINVKLFGQILSFTNFELLYGPKNETILSHKSQSVSICMLRLTTIFQRLYEPNYKFHWTS